MSHFTIGYRLPHFLSVPLFGDRKRFGLTVCSEDLDWKDWEKACFDFYHATQRESSIGYLVNDAGYRIMKHIDFKRLRVLEIGPGDINHIKYWKGKPDLFVAADIRQTMLDLSVKKLADAAVDYSTVLVSRTDEGNLPFDDDEFDLIVSFYAFEHLYPLQRYLDGMLRVLKPGGQIVGAIPCEGGLAWGLGRYLTSRRWLLKNTTINPDKIICWEHPNFADEILATFDQQMVRRKLEFWPLRMPAIDLNLVAKFIYEKR
jgi:SAM-dependent methyltransferase